MSIGSLAVSQQPNKSARRPFDPDYGKTGFALHVYRLRYRRLRLSQRAFASRYGLAYSTLRDVEQGAKPSAALRVLIAAIASNPKAMAEIAKVADEPCRCADLRSSEHCVDWAESH